MSSQELTVIETGLKALEPRFLDLLRPVGMPPERLIRTVIIACDNNDRLRQCTPLSIFQAASTFAVLGLEVDGFTGQGFLVPFNVKGRGLVAQPMVGYRGYPTLGARVGLTIDHAVVREGDHFEYRLGTEPFIDHRPKSGMDRRIIYAWACATAPGRTPVVRVMDIDEILAVKKTSPAVKYGAQTPWNEPTNGFPAMAGKTPVRRLGKSLPFSSFTIASRMEEAHEEWGKHSFIHPDDGLVIDGEVKTIEQGEPESLTDPTARPKFSVRTRTRIEEADTIEQWRARMLYWIERLGGDDVAALRELNGATMDEYFETHPAEVRAVTAALERKLAQ